MSHPDTLQGGVLGVVLPNIAYALPAYPCRVLASGAITFASTVGGSYSTLTGATAEPGVLVSGGFIKSSSAVQTRLVICKKIIQINKTYANLVGRSNPLSYWRFGESSGSTNYDAVARNHLTKGSGVTLAQPGPLGDGNYAVLLDGTINGQSQVAALNSWNGQAAISFEAWVYNAAWSVSHEMVVCCGNVGIYLSVEGGKPIMSIHTGTQLTNKALVAISANAWHHLACTWASGEQLRVYVDGVEVAGDNNTTRTGTLSSSASLYVGSFGGTALFFSGIVDEVAVYLRKLTAAEISNHYGARLVV